MPMSPYASPASAITDAAERTLANARFSVVGRRFASGPRLPLPIDLDAHGVELAFVTFQALRALRRAQGSDTGAVPPVTLAILLANAAVFLKPGGVAFGDVCLNPYAVVRLKQTERLVTSAFVHRDVFHFLNNMTGVVSDGGEIERNEGSASFARRVCVLFALSQVTLVGLSATGRRPERGSNAAFETSRNGARSWESWKSPVGVPFYSSGVVGFSGVNYALKAYASERRPRGSVVWIVGTVPAPARFAFWADLAVNTVFNPSGGTFAAHFAGCLAGLATVYVPKMFRGGFRTRGAGRGRRLGGRDFRDFRDSRDFRDFRDPLRERRGGAAATPGKPRRVGSGNDPEDASRTAPSRMRESVTKKSFGQAAYETFLSSLSAFRRAASLGSPLAVHGACAVGCLLLQQVMARNAPGGVLPARPGRV